MSAERLSPSLRPSLLTVFFLLAFLLQWTSALSQSLCSQQNTGDANSKGSYIYQSNGYCHDQCGGYAFAIVQQDKCWCSNYAPGKTVDVGTFCNKSCPGFPSDRCGDGTAGYYGYIALSASVSGTINPSSATTQPSAPTATQTAPAPVPVSSTKSPSSPSSVQMTYASSTTSSDKTSAATSAWTATPITSVQVITVSGAIVTQTVTNMPTAPPGAYSQTKKSDSVSSGTIAGATVGSVAGFALISGLIIFFLRRRHETEKETGYATDAENSSKRNSPRRNVSVLSKMGLLERTRPVHNSSNGSNNRNSIHTGDSAGVSPVSDRRISHPMFYDQRLNPNALMEHDNGSRTSVMTMEDNRDYTRTLGVRNPDPRPSFEAR